MKSATYISAQTSFKDMAETQLLEFVTIHIGGQQFGIPVKQVRDVLRGQKVARIPLAPPEVAGSLNLRGRIVTAIDMRKRLGLPPLLHKPKTMSVVVEYREELFSLTADEVGEVIPVAQDSIERNPGNLDPRWKEISAGICRMQGGLMVVIDIQKLLHL